MSRFREGNFKTYYIFDQSYIANYCDHTVITDAIIKSTQQWRIVTTKDKQLEKNTRLKIVRL